MNKGFVSTLIITSFLTCSLGVMLPGDSFGMRRYGLTQEGADKEFGKLRAQSQNITIDKPLPEVKEGTDEGFRKWQRDMDKEIKKQHGK